MIRPLMRFRWFRKLLVPYWKWRYKDNFIGTYDYYPIFCSENILSDTTT